MFGPILTILRVETKVRVNGICNLLFVFLSSVVFL